MVEKRLPKQDIANMIGASREMVNRVLKDLHDRGVIRADEAQDSRARPPVDGSRARRPSPR